ncbi:MAG: hemerythrin domain-containing protein [Candidatus Omnitrophota bacterium]
MMPVGPLMKEHRLIERMIRITGGKLDKIKQTKDADTLFIDAAVDFIRTYADKCHHGKEEDILFRELAKKELSDEHKKIMNELIEEHKLARNNTRQLITAKENYAKGDKNALKDIMSNMEILVKFYPKHIEKEDKRFFIPCMSYFTELQRDAMLSEMLEFDRNMIHKKYADIVEGYE